jgi:glycosyltransferase involved in cell wall biosynthesis
MSNSLKILQVLRAPVGGLFRHVCDLTRALNARGHQVGLVVDQLSFDSETEKKLSGISDAAALGIHQIPIPRLVGKDDIFAPQRIAKLINQIDIDVVHGHGAMGGFHARLGASRKPTVKTIYTPHGGVLHFAKNSAQGLIFHNLERALMRHTDKIVFESHFAAKSFAEQIADPGEKAQVVHNGLPESDFEEIIASYEYDFVFVGEMRDLKGVETLLRALAITKRADGTPANLLLIGDGPHRQEFEALATELSLTDRTDFIGANPARMGFAKAQTVVVPSYKESLPYIVMEAVAAGRSVIATNVGGIPEIFGPEAKQLIDAQNVEQLHEKMQAHLTKREAFSAHKQALYAHVRSNFTIEKMCDQIEALYLA